MGGLNFGKRNGRNPGGTCHRGTEVTLRGLVFEDAIMLLNVVGFLQFLAVLLFGPRRLSLVALLHVVIEVKDVEFLRWGEWNEK